MVTESHYLLKAVGLFLSNFAGFSIFNLDVCIWASLAGCPTACTAAIPAPTSWAISPGVSIVASWSWIGSLVPGGGLPVGRFLSYRSLLFSLGGVEGKGDTALRGGLGRDPPLPDPAVSRSLCGGAVAGTAGDLCHHCWVPASKGLPSASQVGGAPGL